jgi:hypothetical protein
MFSARAVFVAVSVVALTAMQAQAEEKEKEPLAIVEIGGSGGWTLSGDSSFGPTVGIEFEPIKNWLEIEIGTGPMFGNGIRELDTDILFKKPFTLSNKVELWSAPGRNGAMRWVVRQKPASSSRSISCFGRHRIENSEGS